MHFIEQKALKIGDVFTPRRATFNPKTYVPRLKLENALIQSIQGSMHSILFGESGNGKSWLYMKVLNQLGYKYKILNCANASRVGSIAEEAFNCTTFTGSAKKSGYSESKEATINSLVASGKLIHENHFQIKSDEPFLSALKNFRKSIGNDAKGILVLDNLESIFKNEKIMNELADIIILLDDERYAEHCIKLLIVGVPNGVLEYFARTKNSQSVANRIEELPKVGGMNLAMTQTIVKNGFNTLLKFNLSEENIREIAQHIHSVTLGIAQRIHEYCEALAYQIKENRCRYDLSLLEATNEIWLRKGLRQAYSVVESHLNSKRTIIARKNQVIYCIGTIQSHQIDSGRVADKVREEFPNNSKETSMGIGSILAELASGDTPLLTKNPRTNEYRIADPRYLMCIRTILKKDQDYKIHKANFRVQ